MQSDPALLTLLDRAREEVPGVEIYDAHTHLGDKDPDGFRCTGPELLELLGRADARGVVFPMHEPDGYPPANDMVIAEAEASDGRLVPFCRLDPEDGPLAEAERALDAGARGIKLHPRAERFALDHPALRDVFALADERRLPVLVHAGRGIPALGRHSVEATGRHPGMRLILAHAGISDLSWIWQEAPSHPNLFFDTSWWAPTDLQGLLALVPPGQVLFASDAPYGATAMSATWAIRHALQVGLTPDQVRSVMGGQLTRLLDGEDPIDAGPARGPAPLPTDPLLDRAHTFLVASLGQGFVGHEPAETLALARLACDVGDGVPHAEVFRWIDWLIENRALYDPGGPERPARFASGLPLIVLASVLARTPDVPLPPLPD
ncbi:MAG: amidohydrolase family protein [Thermoleophilaceae bacterium]|nr:amidohydrolase family protein [Thermoleophilaceae bacterium]